jgi:uncharacterized protein (DUF362 family)
MNKTRVSIVKGKQKPSTKEVDRLVREAVKLAGGLKNIVKKGNRVLVKPNIAYHIKPGETEVTDPQVARTVADLVWEAGGHPFIGEGSSVGVNTEKAMVASGYAALRDEGYEVIAFDKTPEVTVPVKGGIALKEATVYKLAYDADVIISVPVIKTHALEPATLSLKNMKGVLPPKEKKKFHLEYGLFQAIADLNKVVRPHFVVVDGIYCRDGMGYPYSTEVELDLVLAGRDPVAVDTVITGIMDQKPLAHAQLSYEQGVGTADLGKIEVVGRSVEEVKHRFHTAADLFADKFDRYNIIYGDKMCTGCWGMLHWLLKVLEEDKELDLLKDFTIVGGEMSELPEVAREKLILAGKCTARYKDRGRHIGGCPPFAALLISEMKGEEVGAEEEIGE